MESTARERVLKGSGYVLPWILGIAFVLGDFGYIGAGITVAICLWYGAWNWRAVIHWRWAMIVIAFFAAIALKSAIMWLLGEEPFVSFAKAGSRIVSLFGAAAILAAYEEEESERIFGWALGFFAVVIAIITLLIRTGHLPLLLINPNSFGIDCLWFVLYLAVAFRKRENWKGNLVALLVGSLGLVIIYLEAHKDDYGSRTAPYALLISLCLLFLIRFIKPKCLSVAILAVALLGIAFLSVTFFPSIDKLLTHRQQLWNAYLLKGAERPLLGWGYADPDRAKSMLESRLLGRSIHDEFMTVGSGPHNSFLDMFFENGLVALAIYLALLFARATKNKSGPSLFDTALFAYIVLMSSDTMNAGGIAFLGFFLGVCILAGGKRLLALEV